MKERKTKTSVCTKLDIRFWLGRDQVIGVIDAAYGSAVRFLSVNSIPSIRTSEYLADSIDGISKRRGSRPILYSPVAIHAALRSCTVTEVGVVIVPLSYFTSSPTEFRAAFIREGLHLLTPKKRLESLRNSDCIRFIAPVHLDDLFALPADKHAHAPDKRECDVELPGVKVSLPNYLPYFLKKQHASKIFGGNVSERSVGRKLTGSGCVRHVITFGGQDGISTPTRLVRYTTGLLMGSDDNYPDYLIGATVPMSAERALRLFGPEAFGSRWMFRPSEVRTLNGISFYDWTVNAALKLRRSGLNLNPETLNIPEINCYA